MKKLFFAFMAAGLMLSAASCNKCGYCKYSSGSNSSSVCQSGTLIPGVTSEYKQAQSDCKANGGSWEVTN